MTGQPQQQQYFALGVWGPWSSALVDGYKPLENRMWQNAPGLRAIAKRLKGQRLVIHESQKWDARAPRIIQHLCGHLYRREEAHPGHLIGVVTVVDLVDWHHSAWYDPGQLALVVRDGLRFERPIEHSGRQGFMLLEGDKLDKVKAQLRWKGVAV